MVSATGGEDVVVVVSGGEEEEDGVVLEMASDKIAGVDKLVGGYASNGLLEHVLLDQRAE